jgi:hypothetical protein
MCRIIIIGVDWIIFEQKITNFFRKGGFDMKKMPRILFVLGVVLLCLGVFWAPKSFAEVSVTVGANLPAYSFEAPPEMVVIPGTYAYTIPDAPVDIIFYHDYWYRPYQGYWYRSRHYNGPWGFIERNWVPGFFHRLPPDYRHYHTGYDRFRYDYFSRNWRGWERNKHWNRLHDNWKRGRDDGRGHLDGGYGHDGGYGRGGGYGHDGGRGKGGGYGKDGGHGKGGGYGKDGGHGKGGGQR